MTDQRTMRTDSRHSGDDSGQPRAADTAVTQPGRPALAVATAALLPFLASLVFATTDPSAAALIDTKQRPALQFDRYLDFHDVQTRDLVPQLVSEFRFRNTGKETIHFGEITRSCGCMSPELSHQTVAPGESGVLRVPISTARQSPGKHDYMLTVNYTDPDPQSLVLCVKATFPDQMVVVRPRALFLSQSTSTPVKHSFAIDDFRATPLTVLRASSASPLVQAAVGMRMSLPDGGASTEIDIEISGDFPAGRHQFPVAAITDDPEFPVLMMPVFVSGPPRPAEEPVRVQPAMAVLVVNSEEKRRDVVTVDIPSSWTVSHLDAWPDELDATYSISPRNDGNRLVLQIEIGETPARRQLEGVIVVHANESRDMVTVPVMLQWP